MIDYPKSTHVDFRTLKKHNSDIKNILDFKSL